MTVNQQRVRYRTLTALLGVALVGLKVWLVSAQARIVWGTAKNDDFSYLWRAANIIKDNWLGDFTHLTLHTGVGYPIWIALNALHPLPLYIADHLLYALACAVFVWALGPRLGTFIALGLFAALLFNPGSYDLQMRRLVRASIYYSQTLLVVGTMIGFYLRARGRIVWLALWGLGLGVSLGFFWITREEGVWLLPSIFLLLLSLVYRFYRRPAPQQLRRLAVLAIPTTVFAMIILAVSALNYRHYGVFCTTEMKLAEFKGAIAALQRVEHRSPLPYLAIPSEVMERVAPHSEAFQAIAPHIGVAHRNVRRSLGLLEDPRYEGEIPGGWGLWALRNAANKAGFYEGLPQARAFWGRLADEVNSACTNGALECGRESSSLAPPWRPEYLGAVMRSVSSGLRNLATMNGLRFDSAASQGRHWKIKLARRVTGDRLALTPKQAAKSPAEPPRRRLEILHSMASAYRAVSPWCAALALVVWLAAVLTPTLRKRSRFLLIGASLLVAIGTRLALLSYVDITSFFAMKFRFLAPLYPLLIAFVVLMLSELGRWLIAARSSADSSSEPPS